VIDVASDQVETPEEVAYTIGRALQFVARERLLPCTNCGMAPMAREVALAKLKALAEGAAIARKRLATSAAGRRAGKASRPSSRRGTASSRRRR
jgi:5-methyltetrahydropteroyltriglutamate--homocysteine methyltransferase